MKRVVVEEWSFKKTMVYDEDGSIISEEDSDAVPERTISEDEIDDEECEREYAV